MSLVPSYWDFAPPPRVMRIEAREPLQIEIVRNSLGEVMVQTVHAQVSAADAALRARGIDPFGPTKMIGEAQGLTALERLAADVARWNGEDDFAAWRAELRARKVSQSSAPSGASVPAIRPGGRSPLRPGGAGPGVGP